MAEGCLERDYVRNFTGEPRSRDILERAHAHVIKKASAIPDESRRYSYLSSQLKGIRQELSILHAADSFAVEVYESHARAALREGDVEEAVVCLSSLAVLYDEGVAECSPEFVVPRVIWGVLTNQWARVEREARMVIAGHSPKALLSLCVAIAEGNSERAAKALHDLGEAGYNAVDCFGDGHRKSTLVSLLKAAGPTSTPLDCLSRRLLFPSPEACEQWLLKAVPKIQSAMSGSALESKKALQVTQEYLASLMAR
eukprot:Sspe_Gene.69952::Locus_41301_Transcript_1_1_Confidence_1.000_Length_1081::g.69952::m.69952